MLSPGWSFSWRRRRHSGASVKSTFHEDLPLYRDVMRQVKHGFLTCTDKTLTRGSGWSLQNPTSSWDMWQTAAGRKTGSVLRHTKYHTDPWFFLHLNSENQHVMSPLCVPWTQLKHFRPWAAELSSWVWWHRTSVHTEMMDADCISPCPVVSFPVWLLFCNCHCQVSLNRLLFPSLVTTSEF